MTIRIPLRRILGLSPVLGLVLGLALATSAAELPPKTTTAPERLTSGPRAAVADVKPVRIGEEIRTENQGRRVVLGDGTDVFLNRETIVKVTGERRLQLTTGEVYVDVAPRKGKETAFLLTGPDVELTCADGAFAARIPAKSKETELLVVRGSVKVPGIDNAVRAGQRAAGKAITAAPRTSYLLDWTRDLMTAAESPLVPASQHTGGDLVVVDPNGQEAKLSLRRHHIDVYIEDGFARTTVDQTYFNDTDRRLEGTFYFPLPPDASLSRLAMYVDGTLMEGGMVERDYGRQVYDRIVWSQRDPALLEWVDGSTFKMRVFPLEARQEKRIILSYTQRLPALYGQLQYRFPAGHTLENVSDWSCHAVVKGGADLAWVSPSHTLKATKTGSDLVLDAAEKNIKADKDLVLTVGAPTARLDTEMVRFSSFEQDGAKYVMLRYRPAMEAQIERAREPRHWVFLFESSGDRDPLLARTQIEVIRGLLNHADADDTFAVLTANTRVRAFAEKPLPVTPENVSAALTFLEQAHLIGALDLAQALAEAEKTLSAGKNATLVHVGSGVAAMGEKHDDVLAKRLPEGMRYVGIGVGKRWNRNLMKIAAERSGGFFTQINPDESISWRAFDLAATLRTPRLLDVTVRDQNDKGSFLTFTNMLAQGEELCAVTRLAPGEKLPTTVVIRGRRGEEPLAREIEVRDIADGVGHFPRTWAKLEIERLLASPVGDAESATKMRAQIVALSKSMYVMTPFTSLLVLENEEMYEQYKVDRGRKDHWALYSCPAKIDVVYEPLPGMSPDPKKKGKLTAKEVARTVLARNEGESYRIELESPEEPRLLNAMQSTKTLSFQMRGADRPESSRPDSLSVGGGDSANVKYLQEALRREADPALLNLSSEDRRRLRQRVQLTASGQTGLSSATSTPSRDAAAAIRDYYGSIGRDDKVWPAVYFPGKPGLPKPLPIGGGIGGIGGIGGQIGGMPGIGFGERMGQGGMPDVQEQISDLLYPDFARKLVYERPTYHFDDKQFADLVSYCPGMNSSPADLFAVLEAEAAPSKSSKPGTVDDAAHKLFAAARPKGWTTLSLPASGDEPAMTITFDGTGRYVSERILPPGIRERVVCDGKTLLTLYPDLGIGARRTVSRFHRLAFARLVPWWLPNPEDLAYGADLKSTPANRIDMVNVVPHDAGAKDKDGKPLPYHVVRYVFEAPSKRLTRRLTIEMPANKILVSELFAEDGTITVVRGEKETTTLKAKLTLNAPEPDLKVDTKKLVVLPLPYRDSDTVRGELQLEKKPTEKLTTEEGLALFAAAFGENDGKRALEVFKNVFVRREQGSLGFYVFLAALMHNLEWSDLHPLEEFPENPLAEYLILHASQVLRQHASQWAVNSGQFREGYLADLALTHALYQRWSNGKILGTSDEKWREERDRALDYVRKNKGSAFAWGLLCLIQDRTNEAESHNKDVRETHRALVEAWKMFEEVPSLNYAAKYERGRSLWKSGRHAEARKLFRDLYETTLKSDTIPLIDDAFRTALLGEGKEIDEWNDLIRNTATALVKRNLRPAVLSLAWQCQQIGDEALAQALVEIALDSVTDAKDRAVVTLGAVEFYRSTSQLAEAERLLGTLLTDAKQAEKPGLWRLAESIAEERGQPARRYECLERALNAEYRQMPEVVNLEVVREEYKRLLNHYQDLANAMVSLKVEPPADFVGKVVRTADRWRRLDRDPETLCTLASNILKTLGQRDLVWDYLTTPVALRPNESDPWVSLGRELARGGDASLADKAFTAAFDAEPTNAEILWERAQNLRQSGKLTEAQRLYRQLAEGDWQPRFNSLKSQAKWQVEKR